MYTDGNILYVEKASLMCQQQFSYLAAKHLNGRILIGLEGRFLPAEAQLILPTMVLNLSHIARQCRLFQPGAKTKDP